MKQYTYTSELGKMEGEFSAFGVSVRANSGTAMCWWNVPKKYRKEILITSNIDRDFGEFMAETGMTNADITMEYTNRIFFSVNADYTTIITEMQRTDDVVAGFSPSYRLQQINNMRHAALNDAANEAVLTRAKFQDFIRSRYYASRMASNYDKPVDHEYGFLPAGGI